MEETETINVLSVTHNFTGSLKTNTENQAKAKDEAHHGHHKLWNNGTREVECVWCGITYPLLGSLTDVLKFS